MLSPLLIAWSEPEPEPAERYELRGWAVALGLIALGWTTVGLPHSWTHDLAPSCAWERRQWASRTLAASWVPSAAERASAGRCWAGRGGNDPTGETPTVEVLLRKFPSPAQIAAWRNP
jgi:hypothetical protein